ncbi:putative transcription factor Nin-like family [Medicago truncatula]|uniref:Putative transcription factor Nin-like family n=1 Tax=Medicago truncatula TaxID=3880 RepID=A0A396IDK0_MEDTR|nr:putative transcription factor Nin-like family [Medicago truncatula]
MKKFVTFVSEYSLEILFNFCSGIISEYLLMNDKFPIHDDGLEFEELMKCNSPHNPLYIEPMPSLEGYHQTMPHSQFKFWLYLLINTVAADDYGISYDVEKGFGDWREIINDAAFGSDKLYLCYTNENSGNEIKKEVVEVKPERVERISDGNTKNLSRKIISQYFYMPITQAARELNVGLTHLKKRCRELGIRRWPHRKLMSLQTLINNIQELGKEDGLRSDEKFMDIEKLEEEMKLVEEMPDMQLQDHTKRLRQHCFKANYKKRKLMDQLIMF